MKRVRSIFEIFTVFLLIILASFLLLSWQSTANLKASLIQTAQLQTKYAATLLEQKGKEIEIEADGILYGENMQNLYAAIENNDVYEYVQQINKMKSFFQERQGRTVGMSGMTLYWPKSGREISTLRQGYFEDSFWENNKESQWKSANKQEIFYMRRRTVEWMGEDQEVWLVLRMDQDFLYEIKEMAAGMDQGGSILMFGGEINVLSQKSVEQNIAGIIRQSNEKVCEVRVGKQKYQIVRSDETKNGMQLVSYYPTRQMMRQVRNIMTISGIMLGAILIFGMIYISLFVKNILMQMNLLTEKLKQVEVGDLTVQIYKMPKNEFAYVFRQFNHMVRRTHELLEATVKEQELRNEAEMRQLQLQINPHFLYNSLSFIVTAADNPDAVTEMAVYLSQYYRYCTRKKSITTIQEEIDYARSYLEIMAMRKNIEYEIESDPELAACKIPPLILQPIIENAIEHAIEERENAKHIYVKVYQKVKDEICFEISDDGNGLTEEQIAALKERLARKNRDEKEGVGLWNVNQRLVNYYGEQSSLQFGGSIWKGLCVSFVIDGKERL